MFSRAMCVCVCVFLHVTTSLCFPVFFLFFFPFFAVKHLVGIMLCVIAKEEHVPFMKRVQSQTAGVGVMGMMGNKGGAAIRLKFHDTSLCIVAAHLAAHRDNVAGRNADFANILQRVHFEHVSASRKPTPSRHKMQYLCAN